MSAIDVVIMPVTTARPSTGVVARLNRIVRGVDEHLVVRSSKETRTTPWKIWVSCVGGRTNPHSVGGLVAQLQREIRAACGDLLQP